MAPVLESHTVQGGYGTSLSVAIPAGTASGNLLVLGAQVDAHKASNYPSAPGGWSLLKDDDYTRWWWKEAGASESSFNITTSLPDGIAAHLLRISGQKSSTAPQIDSVGEGTGATDSADGDIDCPSVNATDDDSLVIRFGGIDTGTGDDFDGWPSGHTSQYDQDGFDSGSLSTVFGSVYYKTQASAGATGTAAFSATDLVQKMWGVTIVVAPASGGGVTLTIQDVLHGHSADNLLLTQQHSLAVNEALHSHAVDNIDLTQQNILSILEVLHAHSADNVVLLGDSLLSVADTLHNHSVDNIDLSVAHALAVAEALHIHSSQNVDLQTGDILEIQSTGHAATADNVALIQSHVLAIDETLHALVSENIDLSQANIIQVQSTLHSQTADNITLDSSVILIVDGASHAHVSDTINLLQANALSVDSGLHAHSADNIGLASASILVVSDTLHQVLSDNIGLLSGSVFVVPDSRVILVKKRDRSILVSRSRLSQRVH